jgi:hypothetical protein
VRSALVGIMRVAYYHVQSNLFMAEIAKTNFSSQWLDRRPAMIRHLSRMLI